LSHCLCFLQAFQQHTGGFIIGILWDEFTAKGFGEKGWGKPIGALSSTCELG
jgi:hypothetical protein